MILWRVDETYIKVKGKWRNFTGAVDIKWRNNRFHVKFKTR